jgi:hypothetical protein
VEAEERARVPTAPDGAAGTGAPREEPPAGDERPGPHERCAHHGARPAVARCDACGEPICLGCAVPVRGRVLGPGCVAAELGDPALVAPPGAARSFRLPAVAGAGLAVLATAAPWTRTGAGDRPFGAWVLTIRWSIVAALAAIALLGVAWRWARRDGSDAPPLLSAAAVVVASALAIVFPPTFQAASWGPWVCALGAALAAAAVGLATRTGSRSRQGV